MTLEAGDWRVATLDVSPFGVDTAAVLRVLRPVGSVLTPVLTPSEADGVRTYTAAAYSFDVPGEWIEKWTVSGTSADVRTETLLVAPDPEDVAGAGRVYATTADYARWLGAAPPAGSRLALARASRAIESLLVTAVYGVDDDGLPVDADVAAALRDAVCAQAEYARAIGDRYGVGNLGALTSVSIGSVSIGRSASNSAGAAGASSTPPAFSKTALRALAAAGLLYGAPWSY